MVVVAVLTMVDVDLHEIKEILDVVVLATGDFLEGGVEVLVVVDMDLIIVIVGVVEAAAKASLAKDHHFLSMSNF